MTGGIFGGGDSRDSLAELNVTDSGDEARVTEMLLDLSKDGLADGDDCTVGGAEEANREARLRTDDACEPVTASVLTSESTLSS